MLSTATVTVPATFKDALEMIEDLQARNAELEVLVGTRWAPPRVLGLTPTEGRLLGAILAARPSLQMESAYAIIYSGRRNPPEPNTVRVIAHRLRHKLADAGVVLTSRWGAGYSISPDNVSRLDALYTPGEKQ